MPDFNVDACEMAYNNGYRNGYNIGYRDALKDYGVKLWVGDPVAGDIYCPTCGTIGPDNVPTAYLKHCCYCGQHLTFNKGV